jgi:LmbE family N-acetylglucosaminyl deacetylase
MEDKPVELQVLPEDWECGLAVVAHPDDLEYGVASGIARWRAQGKQISYVLVTSGEAGIAGMAPRECGPLREEEERRSARVVGVDSVEFLGHQDGVVEYGLRLRRDIARAIRRHRPEVVFSINFRLFWPGGRYLNMADHRAVGMAVLDACRDAGNRWIFPELEAEGLEAWQGVKMACFNASAEPTHWVDITDHINRGIASLHEHEAYLQGLGSDGDPGAFLRENARRVGDRVGCAYAIDFEVVPL